METYDARSIIKDFSKSYKSLLIIVTIVIFASLAIIFATRINNSNNKPQEEYSNKVKISFEPSSIPTLQLGHYTLWAIDTEGKDNFIKRFNSTGESLNSLNGEQLETWTVEFPDNTIAFKVTIEEEGDRDEEPSTIIYMQGLIDNNEAMLTFAPFDLKNTDYSGSFILATPTDGNSTINENSGIWFAEENLVTNSLNLPEINNPDWAWEARLIYENDTEIIIGRFASPKTADDSNKYSEFISQGPNLPGEDILKNLPESISAPVNLANGKYTIVVSLEPNWEGADPTGKNILLPILKLEIPADRDTSQFTLKKTPDNPQLTITITNEY